MITIHIIMYNYSLCVGSCHDQFGACSGLPNNCMCGLFTCFTGSTRIWDNPYNSQIHLSQGAYTSQGLVEVYCNGQWGTVCDDGFGLTEANTVCRQLGYTGAARYDSLTS